MTEIFESLPPNVQVMLGVLFFALILGVQHLSALQELRRSASTGRAIFYWAFGVLFLIFGLAGSTERPIAFAGVLVAGFIYLGAASRAYFNHKANTPFRNNNHEDN